MKKEKIYLRICLRVLCIYLLVDTLASRMDVASWTSFNLEKWVHQGIKSMYVYLPNGEKQFDFAKFLTTISVYLTVEMDSIINISNLYLGFNEVIKYHSISKFDYMKQLAKILFRLNGTDLLYWLLVFMLPAFLFEGCFSIADGALHVVVFLLLNMLFNYFIALISKLASMSIAFFVIKHFVYSLFIAYEWVLILLMLVLAVVIYHRKEGDGYAYSG